MKVIYWLSLSLAVTFVSTVAGAGERYTSSSPVDSSCAVDVPVGATVEPATGRVTLPDGRRIDGGSEGDGGPQGR